LMAIAHFSIFFYFFQTFIFNKKFFTAELTQCALMNTAASMVRSKIEVIDQESVGAMLKRHMKEDIDDGLEEMELIKKMMSLGQTSKFASVAKDKSAPIAVLAETEMFSVEKSKLILRTKAIEIGKSRIGKWNAELASAIMEAVGANDPKTIRIDETTKEVRMVRKYAIGLRENLNRCKETIQLLLQMVTGVQSQSTREKANNSFPADAEKPDRDVTKHSKDTKVTRKGSILANRQDFMSEMTNLFSSAPNQELNGGKQSLPRRCSTSRFVLLQAGIDTSDPSNWKLPGDAFDMSSTSSLSLPHQNSETLALGKRTLAYVNKKEIEIEWLLTSISSLVDDYYHRIEIIEGYVYMELVGLQLEKYFSQQRANALSAFEKKTDITTAMNIATRKRLPQLVNELQVKMSLLGPNVSHTSVKEAKENHMESKNIKVSLHNLALRRLTRARESSTERIVQMISLLANEIELCTKDELKILLSIIAAIERSITKDDVHMASFGLASSLDPFINSSTNANSLGRACL
jgi:hypothetical protein